MADELLSTEQLIEKRARELADERAKQERTLEQRLSSGKVSQRFVSEQDIQRNIKETVTSPLWSDNQTELITFYTGSNQTAIQKKYYYSVYQSESVSNGSEKQFDVAYGHRYGSGSDDGNSVSGSYKPSEVLYKQFRQVLLNAGENVFTFDNNVTSDSVYFLPVNRVRFKDRVDPGNWELNLSELNGSAHPNQFFTGSNVQVSSSNKVIRLIDDSGDVNQSVVNVTDSGRYYNIVSGSLADGVYSSGSNSYGLFYPDQGVMVFNAERLDTELSFNTVTGSGINGDNAYKLFTSISGSAVISGSYSFQGRNLEDITSTYYYIRLRNADFNFSTNPSFTTGSVGEFKLPHYIGNPTTYITTIGLYNDRNECIAVAKTSRPIPKSFNNEAIIKVKLDI